MKCMEKSKKKEAKRKKCIGGEKKGSRHKSRGARKEGKEEGIKRKDNHKERRINKNETKKWEKEKENKDSAHNEMTQKNKEREPKREKKQKKDKTKNKHTQNKWKYRNGKKKAGTKRDAREEEGGSEGAAEAGKKLKIDQKSINAELDWTGSGKNSEKIRNQLAQKVLAVIGEVGRLFEGEVVEKDGKEEEPEELKNVMKVVKTVEEIQGRKGFVIQKHKAHFAFTSVGGAASSIHESKPDERLVRWQAAECSGLWWQTILRVRTKRRRLGDLGRCDSYNTIGDADPCGDATP